MFGEKLDYLLLRPLAHGRHRATEEELNAEGGASSLLGDQFVTKLPRVIDRFDGHFPVSPALRYLDMGCGSGELTLGLARLGIHHILGVDIMPRFIEKARRNALEAGLAGRVEFVCADLHAWRPKEKFDVVISFDALEHIDNPRAFMATMAGFLVPGGVAVLSFGPLFHSPFGDHMAPFFRVQIPWRGALFSERAIMRLRREFYRPTDPSTRYSEVAGGLNRMRYSEFLRYAAETGWAFRYLRTNTFLGHPVLRAVSTAASRLPLVRDCSAHNVYAVLVRAQTARASQDEPREAERTERMAA